MFALRADQHCEEEWTLFLLQVKAEDLNLDQNVEAFCFYHFDNFVLMFLINEF